MEREYAIVDDNGIVHEGIIDELFPIVWGIMTQTKEECFQFWPKLHSQPEVYDEYAAKYVKPINGKLRLMRVMQIFDPSAPKEVEEQNSLPRPFCTGCNRFGSDIPEYVNISDEGLSEDEKDVPGIEEYIRAEEGTYNEENGHFLCTDCYIKAGQPSTPVGKPGWVAP